MTQRKMGPLAADHPLVRNDNQPCVACRLPFAEGEFVTLVLLGPGDDTEGRERRDQGRAYNAVAAPVHWDCSEQQP